ncbi:MAG TPA: hypothetical protein VFG20_19160 [Planctomycetaceae bacterium]|nr:hypothetical protein [Planctomycetaceae bacterium]
MFSRIVVVSLVLFLSGCSDSGPQLAPVVGHVTLDGKPLPRGSISLRPESTKDGWEQPTGSIDADGKYAVYTQGRPGAPPGRYRVIIFATEATHDANGAAHPGLPTSIVPAIYNDPERTPLKIEATLQSRAPFDLELSGHDAK